MVSVNWYSIGWVARFITMYEENLCWELSE
jgi:hypothetical protein